MSEFCFGCGSALEGRNVQMRSADEPAQLIQECPRCPITVQTRDWNGLVVHVEPVLIAEPSKAIQDAVKNGIRTILTVPKQKRTMLTTSIRVAAVEGGTARMDENGDWWVTKVLNRQCTAPNVFCECYSVHKLNYKPSSTVYIDVHLEEGEMDEHSYNVESTDTTTTYLCEMANGNATEQYRCATLLMIVSGYTTTCKQLVGSSVLNFMKTLSPRAVDAEFSISTHIESLNGRYVAKIDGVREWLVQYGPWWMMFNPYRPDRCTAVLRGIVGVRDDAMVHWEELLPLQRMSATSVGWILDVERRTSKEGSSSLYLIDVIKTPDGEYCAEGRSAVNIETMCTRAYHQSRAELNGCLVMYSTHNTTAIELMLRTYHTTLDSIQQEISNRNDVDGIVGVVSGMQQYKLKQIRTVDLIISEVGGLKYARSRDGSHMLGVALPLNCITSTIWEYTVEKDGSDALIKPKCSRGDKEEANVQSVVQSIISLALNEGSGTSVAQTIISYSMHVRTTMYEQIRGALEMGDIIVDVGCASGEAIKVYREWKCGGIVVLVDVNEEVVERLRRTHGTRVALDVQAAVDMVRAVKVPEPGKDSVLISVVADAGYVIRSLVGERSISRVIAVSLFSCNYLIDSLIKLNVITEKLRVYGCFYSYEDVPVDERLFAVDDVSMGPVIRNQGRLESTVRFRDQVYVEPVIPKYVLQLFLGMYNAEAKYPFKDTASVVQVVAKLMSALCLITPKCSPSDCCGVTSSTYQP